MDEVTAPRGNKESGQNLFRQFEDTQGKLFVAVNKPKVIPVVREECCPNPPRAEGNENIIGNRTGGLESYRANGVD